MSDGVDALFRSAERGGHDMTSKSANIIPFERGGEADAAGTQRIGPAGGETWRRLDRALNQAALSELDCVLDTHNEALWVYQQHFQSLTRIRRDRPVAS
jgi:hypothetical protein